MTSPLDEPGLVAAARAGSDEAFRQIIDQYHERLHAVVLRIVRDRSDAEEVVQQTFLKAWRNLARFQEDSSLYTWLYRIAVNASVDLAKKERRRRHLSLDDEGLGLDPTAEVDEALGPTARSEREELLALVRQGIQELPEHYRTILVLREYGDRTYEDLGEILGLPKGTVESRLFRARMKLREWLVRRFGEQGLEPEEFGF